MAVRFHTLIRRLIEQAARISAEVRELEERRDLLNRPWEEEFLHWARDERGLHLHGHLVPPPKSRTSSVTSTGWCPGLQRVPGPDTPPACP
jgi:hypothetical protein